MQKGSFAMGHTTKQDARNPKIVPLVTAEEQAEVEALARYWDARLQRRSGNAAQLSPETREMVQLLEHYREVTEPPPFPTPMPIADSPSLWLRPRQVAVMALVMVALLLFACNTLLSPRSWLLSSAHDPDWIPWISDDWLGAHAVTAEIVIPLNIVKDMPGGA